MYLLREERYSIPKDLKELANMYQQEPREYTWNWILGVHDQDDGAEHEVG